MVTRSGPSSKTDRNLGSVNGVNTLRSVRVSISTVSLVNASGHPLIAQIGPPIDMVAVAVEKLDQRSKPPWRLRTSARRASMAWPPLCLWDSSRSQLYVLVLLTIGSAPGQVKLMEGRL